MSQSSPIRSVAIIGRDSDAWLTALLLRKALGKQYLENGEQPLTITLVELPSHTLPQDVITTLPTQRLLHQLLGLSESNVVESSGGTPSLGYFYAGWRDHNSGRFQLYDNTGASIDRLPFFHYWNRARQRGLNTDLDEFSLAAAAARRGKMLRLNNDIHHFAGGAFSGTTYAYNLSAPAYVKGIARLALDAGVTHRISEVKTASIGDGGIQSVLLDNGESIHADLFIDASGTGELIDRLSKGSLDQDNFESWNNWFPCDRALVASMPRLRPQPALNQIVALSCGWMGLYPLAARTGVLVPFDSQSASSEQILQTVQRMTARKLIQPQIRTLNIGVRSKPWRGNCVAVGTSAASLDPLQGLQMQVLHTSLSYLLSLFPAHGNQDYEIERELYNSRLYSHVERLRDFQLAGYLLNQRPEPFWRHCAGAPIPQPLADKIDLFKTRGNIPLEEHEPFDEPAWQALFAGCGLMPESYHPLADLVPDTQQIEFFQDILRFVAAQAERMPDLERTQNGAAQV
ncbi:tryptophan 7-halogenase [Microbulbifer bruguierae]|uniref:Tryptophan 7-halogenase n=1 Tax=Microbulbifer bruguierae TaxID=3029061 RepID=A0ABY8NIG8_9GAMM|nr:tryptophan 7-halogenase [Microbulbifer bruguierae]WGL18387.1 tryptophan 7-halogenase [Microbulbifer bruguierae]